MHRRNFIKAGAALTMLNGLGIGRAQDVPTHNWDRYDLGSGPTVSDRLNQGPFGIDQDEGWYTVLVTSQSDKPVRNYGLILFGYTWEEAGPSLAARQGKETLERHVENLSSLPFVDVPYTGAIGEMCKRVPVNFTKLIRRTYRLMNLASTSLKSGCFTLWI